MKAEFLKSREILSSFFLGAWRVADRPLQPLSARHQPLPVGCGPDGPLIGYWGHRAVPPIARRCGATVGTTGEQSLIPYREDSGPRGLSVLVFVSDGQHGAM